MGLDALDWISNSTARAGQITVFRTPERAEDAHTAALLEPYARREEPDLDEVYDELMTRMQGTLTALQQERTLPLIG